MTIYIRFALRLVALGLVALGLDEETANLIWVDPELSAMIVLSVSEFWFALVKWWGRNG